MKLALLFLAGLVGVATNLPGQPSWQETLATMPLPTDRPLTRDNCLPSLLAALQSNSVVKALIVLPEVADDFYLIRRDEPKVAFRADNLMSLIGVLTNRSQVRVTFQPPFLLLHLDRDRLEPSVLGSHQATAVRLQREAHLPHILFIDSHWQKVQPLLQETFNAKVLPPAPSTDAWHFARAHVAGWGLSDWEVLTALSLASRTAVTVQRNRIVFRLRDGPNIPKWSFQEIPEPWKQ